MPSVIPYDPSLALGNIVGPQKLQHLEKMGQILAPADKAEDALNSLIALRRSIDMTTQELANLRINTQNLQKEGEQVSKEIEAAAVEYAKLKVNAKKELQKMAAIGIIDSSWESPLDYNRSEIKKMPLSSDTLNMNVQYFSFDQNSQSSETQAQAINTFVSGELSYLGNEFSSKASKAAQSQTSSQYSRHSIQGTLVIAVSCTHKNASLLAPCILDVDKAIRVWNAMYPGDMIKTNDYSGLMKIAAESQTKKENAMHILSGATYGSCFVGMVHILNDTTTMASERMYSVAKSIEAQFKTKLWICKASGGFGVNDSFSNDVKNLLSTQNISSHCTLATRGIIPSIKSNQVKMAVKQFTKFDGAEAMESLAALQNATAADKDSVDAAAEQARAGQQITEKHNSKIKGVLSGLSEIDSGNNKILDINSMMTAFDDYVDKALGGELGVPINFYVKPITKSQLAEMWVSKYFPREFLQVSSGDDSQPAAAS